MIEQLDWLGRIALAGGQHLSQGGQHRLAGDPAIGRQLGDSLQFVNQRLPQPGENRQRNHRPADDLGLQVAQFVGAVAQAAELLAKDVDSQGMLAGGFERGLTGGCYSLRVEG